MRLPTSLPIAALAATVLAAAPAHAGWSPPAVLDAGGRAASAPLLSPARAGAATLFFKADNAAARATIGADLAPGAFRPLGVGYTAAAADARGRGLLARVERDVLRVRTVTADGALGPRVRVTAGATNVSLEVNRAGDAVLAVSAGDRIFAATGDTRSGFGPLQQLSGRRATAVDAAINGAGDAVVAFRHRGRLRAADRPAAATRFGAARDLGPSAAAEAPDLQVALGARGAAVAAWTDGQRFVAASRGRRGAWGAPQELSDRNRGAGIGSEVVVLGDRAVVAYSTPEHEARLAQGPADGELGRPVTLSAAGAPAGRISLAAGSAGDLAVVWTEDLAAKAAVQPAGGDVGPAQDLDTAGRAALEVAVVAAAAGRFTAAVETGRRWKGSRDIRITGFTP